MFKPGDIVSLQSGERGEFVRYYGAKIQIRVPGGDKVTGFGQLPVAGKKPYVAPQVRSEKLGAAQTKVLQAIMENPQISYREIGIAAGMPTPRAASVVRSLCDKGIITKNIVEGKNKYGFAAIG